MEIDPCSPQEGPELCSDVKCCHSAFSSEKVRAPYSGWSSLPGTSKWLIIGQFQFVAKDSDIPGPGVTGIRPFNDAAICAPGPRPLSRLSSQQASSDFISGHDSELCSLHHQAPPTKKLAMFTETSAVRPGWRVFARVLPRALWQTRN